MDEVALRLKLIQKVHLSTWNIHPELGRKLFNYLLFLGAVDLDKIDDPILREATEGMINNFGQTPTQLLKKAHPKRKTLQEVDMGKPRVINHFLSSNTVNNQQNNTPTFSLIEVGG